MRRLFRSAMCACAVLTFLVANVALSGAQGAPSAAQTAAEKLYLAKDYQHAAESFRGVVAAEPANGLAWYRLGVSLQMLGKLDEAQQDLSIALERGFHPFSVHYRFAQIALQRGDKKKATAELEKAVATMPTPPQTLSEDETFASLRGTPEFVALLDKQERAFHPCRFDASYQRLDFWVGDWVVHNVQGQEMGRSHVEGLLDGCVIAETWTGSLGGNGKSLSFYNATTKRWEQHYINNAGAANNYVGQADGKSLVLISLAGTPAKPALRMTYTPLADGRVRQLIETSADGGATWAGNFDGYYTKVPPAKP